MSKHSAAGLLDALDRHTMGRGHLLREVTITDPLWLQHRAAEWAQLYPQYPDKRYARIDTTGIVPDPAILNAPAERRIDGLLVDAMDKTGHYRRTAVEVKISRADFRRETEEKRRPWRAVTHRFYYLAPAGVIPREELPPYAGLWECDWMETPEGLRYNVPAVRRRATAHEPQELWTEDFASYLLRRAAVAASGVRQDLERAELRRQLRFEADSARWAKTRYEQLVAQLEEELGEDRTRQLQRASWDRRA